MYGNRKASNGTTYQGYIPKRPKYGCPKNDYGCTGNDCSHPEKCFCEEHCSWDKCRLFKYPTNCLKNVRSGWIWDSVQNFWVAQVGEGKITNSLDVSCISERILAHPFGSKLHLFSLI